MKSKYIKYILLSIFTVISVITISIFFVLNYKNLNIPKENLGKLALVPCIKDWLEHNHPLFQNTNFWISYLGFDNFISMSNNGLWNLFALNIIVFLPLFGSLTAFFWIFFLSSILWKKIRRVELATWNKTIVIISFVLFLITLFTLFTNMIIVESFENTKYATEPFIKYYGEYNHKIVIINNKNILLDAVRLFNLIIAEKGLIGFCKYNSIPNTFSNSMVFLILITPIVSFLTLSLFTFVISNRVISYSYNLTDDKIENIKRWLKYSDIPSKKEIKKRYFKNPPLMISMSAFILVMFFPVFIPINFSENPVIFSLIMLLDVVVILVAFIPFFIIYRKTVNMDFATYNFYIFIQFLTFFFLGFLWQCIIWLSLSNDFTYFDYVPIILIFIYLFLNILSIILFVSNK